MSDWEPDLAKLQGLRDEEWLQVEQGYCGRLLAYASRRTGDHQASEDIVQETLLGAVRGIADFDPSFTFEQYLFGICRNRTIDYLRRRRARTMQVGEEDSSFPGMETFAHQSETPSAIVRSRELSDRARFLLGDILRDWVDETWEQKEFTRLSVVEALFSGGWRNRDTWQRFGLRDETAVAGIKFRALKRLRQLAAQRESGSDLLGALEAVAEGGDQRLEVDVRDTWRERRVSCPSRFWLAKLLAKTLEGGPHDYIRFHLDEMACPWCQANYDDLGARDRDRELDPFLERVQESTLDYLRSKTVTPPGEA